MHPVLLELGPLTLHTYGLFIAAAFLAGIAWSMREARQRGLSPGIAQDIGLISLVGAIIGSRLLYVLINPVYFLQHPLEIVMFWRGGLVFLGGVILAVAMDYVYLKRKNQEIMAWPDVFAPGLALGQAIGRLGCFSAGCCFGKTCELPFAVTFTAPNSLAPLFVPLHPTQLYHSLAGLVTFAVLLAAKPALKGKGQLAGLFLLLYSVLRFTIEFFRDDYRGELGIFSVTQVIAAGLFLLGTWLILRKRRG